MQAIHHQINVGVHPTIGSPCVRIMTGLDLLIQASSQGLLRRGFSDQMAKNAPVMGPSTVLPEIDRLPGAQGKSSRFDAEAEGLTGERRADVGGHVIGAFVVVAVPTGFGHDDPHPIGEILKNPRIGVFIDGEAGTGVQAGEMQHSLPDGRVGQPLVDAAIEAGESLPRGLELQVVQNLLQCHRQNATPGVFSLVTVMRFTMDRLPLVLVPLLLLLLNPSMVRAQRVVLKLAKDCPIGYLDTGNGRCCSFGQRVDVVQPREGRVCPSQWTNVGGGYCRRE